MTAPLSMIPGGGEVTEPLVDARELAAILGVSTRTITRMVADGQIPSVTYGRRVRRFRASVVIAQLARLEAGTEEERGAA
jgi:excisionase family DNA binding protein